MISWFENEWFVSFEYVKNRKKFEDDHYRSIYMKIVGISILHKVEISKLLLHIKTRGIHPEFI